MKDQNLCVACFAELGTEVSPCPHCGYDVNEQQNTRYLPLGTMLKDTYRIGKVIRSNGESTEYYGYDLLSECRIVVKEYLPENLSNRGSDKKSVVITYGQEAQFKAMLHDFMQLSSDLMKKNGLSCLFDINDIFLENNTGYVIYEYKMSATLGRFVQEMNKDLSGEEVWRIMSNFASSIKILHENNIVHRCIAPETIAIVASGEMKLTDFASAAARTKGGCYEADLYDGYAAPEQYKTDGWQGEWTDVFGFCACLYYLITRTDPSDVQKRIEGEKLLSASLFNKKISKEFSAVISKGLSLRPEDRYQSMSELIEALNAASGIKEKKEVAETADKKNVVPAAKSHAPWYLHKWMFAVYSFGATILFLGIIVSVLWLMMGNDTSGGIVSQSSQSSQQTSSVVDETKTPNFVGKTIAEINSDPELSKYTLEVKEDFHDTIPVGVIISQNPENGSIYEKGQKITVTTSKGPESIAMPNIVGKSKTDAAAILLEAGIDYDFFEVYDANVAEGEVVRTSIAAGTMMTPSKQKIQVFVCKK